MDRQRARDLFWTVYALGFGIGLLIRVIDPPRALFMPIAILYVAALVWFGGHWLRAAVSDGSFTRAVPDYAWAFFGLLVIALGCGGVTLVVHLALGAEFTATDVSTGAFFGTFAVLGAWWMVRGRHAT